jgi:hypothetical protein
MICFWLRRLIEKAAIHTPGSLRRVSHERLPRLDHASALLSWPAAEFAFALSMALLPLAEKGGPGRCAGYVPLGVR